ncbi:MAG TPA: hypothetical protein VFR78_05685 [Pyrinomonadaceae bacterium]|nr:hypothetical protein [Pyrinomonadaceae bacterium]
MNRLTLLCASLVCGLFCAITAAAQTFERFDYSAYNPVSSGVFANFTYPARPLFKGAGGYDGRRSFTLKQGIFEPGRSARGYIDRLGAYLKSVEFADVTGDGHKEALVAVGILCDCSGVWFGIYIYELTSRNPTRLLWAFQTGDRAVGGLRRVYGQRGRLVVELYGIGSGPNSRPKNYYGAQCCTNDYTRRRYRWKGRRFIQQGKARLLSESKV